MSAPRWRPRPRATSLARSMCSCAAWAATATERSCGLENVAILAEMLPDARTQTLPELDHLAPLTHPAALASAIGEYLSSRAGGGRHAAFLQ